MENPGDNGVNNVDTKLERGSDERRDKVAAKIHRLTASPVPTSSVLTGGKNEDDSDNMTVDSENDGQDDSTPTALLPPEIFENVLRFLETRDLLICRLVNSHWCGIATNILRQNSPIIHFENPSEMFLPPKSSTSSSATSNSTNSQTGNMNIQSTSFLDTMDKSKNNPCGKFVIDVKKNLDEYQPLIDTLGSDITYLEINSNLDMNETSRKFGDWMSSMTNLHTLKMDYSKIFEANSLFSKNDDVKLEALKTIEIKNIGGMWEANPDFLDGLFSRAHNLQTLIVDVNERECIRRKFVTSKNVEKILTSFKNHGKLSVMKDMGLTLMNSTVIDILLQMTTNGLKLRSLSLKNSEKYGSDPDKIQMFLETQKDYLEELILGQRASKVVEFPENMPALKILHLDLGTARTRYSIGPIFQSPVDFSKQFSSLSELKLQGYWNYESMQELFGQNERAPRPCTTLKTLKLPHGDGLETVETEGLISEISKIFPNVNNLDLRHPKNHTLYEVWESWPGLTTLKIVAFYSEEEDIVTEECLDLGFTGLGLGQLVPSIADLKDLRNLELKLISLKEDGDGNPVGGIVTDLLIYLGLIKMPHLKLLNICEWFPAAKPNHCVMGSTYDFSRYALDDLKRILKDTRISVMSIHGRDFQIPDFLLDYLETDLTGVDETPVCVVNARNVLSGDDSVRNRGYKVGWKVFSILRDVDFDLTLY